MQAGTVLIQQVQLTIMQIIQHVEQQILRKPTFPGGSGLWGGAEKFSGCFDIFRYGVGV